MHEDKTIISAVINGDKERYEELVERYQKMVYGIAWSRLGDSDICDDVIQDTFVYAYKCLTALRDYTKFPAWLAKIARNMTANAMRRIYRENDGIRKWSLENKNNTYTSQTSAENELTFSETLNQLIEKLPDQSREALVLFYMQDKSIREAAEMLGISESSFKTRLFRARDALRNIMQEQLNESFAQLNVRKDYRKSIMAAIPPLPIGGGISAFSLSKFFLPLNMIFFTIITKIPFFLLVGWYSKSMANNMKSGNEFRKKIIMRNFFMLIPITILIMILSNAFVKAHGYRALNLLLAVYLVPALISTRLTLRVTQNPYIKATMLGYICMFVSCLAGSLFTYAGLLFPVAMLIFNIALFRTRKYQPYTQDLNLALRMVKNNLTINKDSDSGSPVISESSVIDFAKFLGEKLFICDYKKSADGFTFYLPGIMNDIFSAFIMPIRRYAGASKIMIGNDGRISCRISSTDKAHLQTLCKGSNLDFTQMEIDLSLLIKETFLTFQSSQLDNAYEKLGGKTEAAVFIKPPHELRSTKILYFIAIFSGVIMVISFLSILLFKLI